MVMQGGFWGVGLGKPLKSILHGKPMRFFCASITPGGMRLASEIAISKEPLIYSHPLGVSLIF
jgi:hypothetical protein